MKKCVFAGSFDPITNGHMHVIDKCCMMFEEVLVVLAINAQKKCLFSKDKRLEMMRLALKDYSNVKVVFYDGMIADFMREQNVSCYVRGVRDQKDIEYEEKCFKITSSLNPDVELMLFQSPKSLVQVSSTYVKELIKNKKNVSKYVPESILPLLL